MQRHGGTVWGCPQPCTSQRRSCCIQRRATFFNSQKPQSRTQGTESKFHIFDMFIVVSTSEDVEKVLEISGKSLMRFKLTVPVHPRPSCVLVQVEKHFPSVITSTGSCQEYEIGDLVWAKVGTYPWWPCMVSSDPQSNVHIRLNTRGNLSTTSSYKYIFLRLEYSTQIYLNRF